MSSRYRGSLISATAPTVSPTSASGIWAQHDQYQAQAANLWPASNIPGVSDEYFQYVSLLLHGDGTNGAQNNTFLDSSTNNFTITRNGNTTQGPFSPFSKPDGRWGNYFDGSGDRLTSSGGANSAVGSGDFCVEFFVYYTA
jgi:hypothetical protein